jgi:hypothetical protein
MPDIIMSGINVRKRVHLFTFPTLVSDIFMSDINMSDMIMSDTNYVK